MEAALWVVLPLTMVLLVSSNKTLFSDSKSIIADIQVGQTVVGHVRSINTEKQTFNIDLKVLFAR